MDGMVVYVWRSNPRSKIRGWVGPGVVICVNAQKTSAWVSMRGVVVKCSMDRVRKATDEEWLGAELIRVLSRDCLRHMQRQGQRGYVDTADEEPPPSEPPGDGTTDDIVGSAAAAEGTDLVQVWPIPSEDAVPSLPEPRADTDAMDTTEVALVPVPVPVDIGGNQVGEPEWVDQPDLNVQPQTPREPSSSGQSEPVAEPSARASPELGRLPLQQSPRLQLQLYCRLVRLFPMGDGPGRKREQSVLRPTCSANTIHPTTPFRILPWTIMRPSTYLKTRRICQRWQIQTRTRKPSRSTMELWLGTTRPRKCG